MQAPSLSGDHLPQEDILITYGTITLRIQALLQTNKHTQTENNSVQPSIREVYEIKLSVEGTHAGFVIIKFLGLDMLAH